MTRLVPALTALMLVALPAQAHSDDNIVLQTFNTATVFTPPPWVTNSDTVIDDSEVFQNQETRDDGSEHYLLELLPKGENRDNWTRMSILAAQTQAPTVSELYGARLTDYQTECTSLDHEHVVELDAHQTGVILCGARVDTPDQGEALIFNIIHREGTAITTAYRHRGAAFDVAAPESYPLSLDAIADILADLAATGVYPLTE